MSLAEHLKHVRVTGITPGARAELLAGIREQNRRDEETLRTLAAKLWTAASDLGAYDTAAKIAEITDSWFEPESE
jgi:hypothetical protein